MKPLVVILMFGVACGDNLKPAEPQGPIRYTDPSGGKLRLIQSVSSPPTSNTIVLDLVVGDQPLTGYSVGFDLPIDDTQVKLDSFTPGTALNPGTAPVAATGLLQATGTLAHQLVTAQSQKASGPGAVVTDTALPAGTVLYSFELGINSGASGTVFDGTAAGFLLPSGGMRDRAGTTVVAPKDVAIGKLVLAR
jgi:hypothetical protein